MKFSIEWFLKKDEIDRDGKERSRLADENPNFQRSVLKIDLSMSFRSVWVYFH